MNPLHNNGQLNTDIFTDEINQPIQLTYDQEKQYWQDIFTVIHFGNQRLTDAEFHIENDIAHITANALIAGISLTFDYDDSNNRFESDEKINIIHIVADQIHTLTDFSISQTGEITASLVSEQLIDLTGKNIQLKYNESGDTWYSEQMRTVKYGKCQFDNAHIFLNDYDFFLKGIPPFSDKEIEFNFGKTAQKEIYFHASNVHWQIGDHAFQSADIRFFASGQLEACGQLKVFDKWVDFLYDNGKMLGKVETIKKYLSPEKGCFKKNPYYQLNILNEIEIYIFNTRQMKTATTYKLMNPFVANLKNKDLVAPKTVLLTADPEDGKYKATVPQQTAMYKGLAKNGFLGDYFFEESKQYIFDPESEILTVGTKFLEGHGKLFYKKVYNYYYKNFEQYSVVKGFWPFRRLEYQYYYQMLSQMSEPTGQ